MISAILAGFLALCGIVSGLVALCGVRRHGRERILWPASTGLVIWLLLFVIALPSFLRARQLARDRQAAALQPSKLKPAVHSITATRVEDADIGYSFDLPDDYKPLGPSTASKGYSHAYIRQVPFEANRLIFVKPMGGTLPRQRLNPGDVPPGKTLLTFNWRGLDLDAIRVPEKVGDVDYLTFNIQIPLRKQAIQLGVAGPAEAEAKLRLLAEQTLSTLEGESNW